MAINFSSFRRSGVSLRSRSKSLVKSYAAASDKTMAENWDNGFIDDNEYLTYLQGEVAGRAWLTPSQKVGNSIKVSDIQGKITDTAWKDAYTDGTVAAQDYISYKQSKLSSMAEGSLAYRDLQKDISGLYAEQQAEIVRQQAELDAQQAALDAENKRLRGLQYTSDLLTISEWGADTLSKAKGKELALEKIIKDMEEYGDNVDEFGNPTNEYMSAQTRLNNAMETSADLFEQRDQLRKELTLDLSDLDTVPDLEAKRAIAEEMLEKMIERGDEIGYLRVANKIAGIDDSLRNAYEAEYKRGLGMAEKSEQERIALELRGLDDEMARLDQLYQSGEIGMDEYVGNKLELYIGNEGGARGYQQVLSEKASSGVFTDTERYRATEKLRGLSDEVNETANLMTNLGRGLVHDVVELDRITGIETRKPKWVDPANVIDLTNPSSQWNLENVLDEQGNFTGIYIRDSEGNLRRAELSQPGIDALKQLGTENFTAQDLFETGYLTVPRFDSKLGYIESRYNKDTQTWDTIQPTAGGDATIPYMSGGKSPFERLYGTNLPMEERASFVGPGTGIERKGGVAIQPAPAITQSGVNVMKTPATYQEIIDTMKIKQPAQLTSRAREIMKTPEYATKVKEQIDKPWGQDIQPQPFTESKPDYKVPNIPTYQETIDTMKIKQPAQLTPKALEIMATPEYQQSVQTQAQKAVAKGIPWENTLAGYNEQKQKEKEKKGNTPWWKWW